MGGKRRGYARAAVLPRDRALSLASRHGSIFFCRLQQYSALIDWGVKQKPEARSIYGILYRALGIFIVAGSVKPRRAQKRERGNRNATKRTK